MTPAERVAELRGIVEHVAHGHDYGCCLDARAELAINGALVKLLALAEAVPARLASGHGRYCAKFAHTAQVNAGECTCGHDALAAAWAALGDA